MASTVPVQASPFLLFSLPSRARSTPPPRPCRAAAHVSKVCLPLAHSENSQFFFMITTFFAIIVNVAAYT